MHVLYSLQSLHPAIILAALCVAAAFCVAGLMIQHEAEKQRRIAERVRDERDERRADRLRHSRRASRLSTPSTPLQAYPVPLAGVLDGGAPLAGSVVLVDRSPDRPMDRPTLRQVTGQSTASTASTASTPSIPDESPESDADSDDISTQTTQKLPVAARSARPVPPETAPKILEAWGGHWLRTPPWTLPDNARN